MGKGKKNNGKKSKFVYYVTNGLRLIGPRRPFRRRLERVLAEVEQRPDREEILARVDYYNKLSGLTGRDGNTPGTTSSILPDDASKLADFRLRGNISAYFFDSFEYTRWFDPALRWKYLFGDVTRVPPWPAIVKSRPIGGDNANSVLLNLDKARHFIFLNDRTPFREKIDKAIFRGHILGKPHRIRFMELFHGHPMCDAGIIPSPNFPAQWVSRKLSLKKHLKYKFVVSLEGNDVASNLKWIMSSNSLPVMPRPKYETWFMEGTLIPNHHYVEIRDDYGDLIEKIQYYIDHADKAEEISRNAHAYIDRFRDKRREKLISLLVLAKYFRQTGQ